MKRAALLALLTVLRGGCPASSEAPEAPAPSAKPSPPVGFVEVAVGDMFSCARLGDGTVRCWGWNRAGQLGDGTFDDHPVPTPVSGLTDVVEIAAGERHACARKKDGTVLCWGDNTGEGTGDTGDTVKTPFAVPIAKDVVHMALGWSRTCVVHAKDVGCWGEYVDQGNSTSHEIRMAMPAQPSSLVVGGERACAIVGEQALCWGENERLTLAPGYSRRLYEPEPAEVFEHVASIALGFGHVCAVGTDRHVRCMGENHGGQLGDGTTESRRSLGEVKGAYGAIAAIALSQASCALLQDGTVTCWGGNNTGVLGDGTTKNSSTPVRVQGLSDVEAISGKSNHLCALTRDHRVFCWGANRFGELGQPSLRRSAVPREVTGIDGATSIAAAGAGTCVVVHDAKVVCFGDVLVKEDHPPEPVPIDDVTGVVELAMNAASICGRTSDGGLRCAHGSYGGQTADELRDAWDRQRGVDTLSRVAQVALADDHGCARFDDRSVKCWGRNDFGQRGDGSHKRIAAPARVEGVSDVRSIALGPTESCALSASGTVSCWGSPTQSYYGIEDDPGTPFPVNVKPATLTMGKATAIAHGRRHGCAVLEDGTVSCWGRNDYGQLGDGTVGAPRVTPAPVHDLAGVADLALGSFFGCARTRDGKVFCWGDNFEGQLGDGTTSDRKLPVLVKLPVAATAIAAGHTHACALLSNGRVMCWGANDHRQLGTGSPVRSSVPLEVALPK